VRLTADGFRTPDLLFRYGIHRAINVILQGDGRPFGVLEVDGRSEDEFTSHDLTFLQGAANVLGMAIERERQDRRLKAALAHQEVLLKEITHRVKNSLAIVASMLQLQASHIHPRNQPDKVDLGLYIEEVCRDLNEIGHRTIHVEAQRDVPIATDRAIPIALIVNELITNATKCAYEGRDGRIFVRFALPADDVIELGVRDEGVGLPPGFQLHAARSLGMRIVLAFVQQLNAKLTFDRLDPGLNSYSWCRADVAMAMSKLFRHSSRLGPETWHALDQLAKEAHARLPGARRRSVRRSPPKAWSAPHLFPHVPSSPHKSTHKPKVPAKTSGVRRLRLSDRGRSSACSLIASHRTRQCERRQSGSL
jgi:two-component sensor histidine kinase